MKYLVFILSLFVLFNTSAFSQNIIDIEYLLDVKENLDGIECGYDAYSSLVESANKVINLSISPVTDKKYLAASGDTHDYVSIGRYWWPDSTKTDGLPYVRNDGYHNPELKDFDRKKLGDLTQSVSVLSYAYFFTKEDIYAKKAIENLRIWFLDEKTRMNPNLNYAQIIRGHNGDAGRSEGLIDAYGFVEMLSCVELISESGLMTKNDYEGLKKWFSDFLDWMLTSDLGIKAKGSKNNHGTAYDVQIVAYSLFVGRLDIANKYIQQFAENRLFKQIESDGKQPLELERKTAFHYSLFNIGHFLDMCTLAKSIGIDIYDSNLKGKHSIDMAIKFMLKYLGKPSSSFPYEEISNWETCQERLCWILKRSTQFKANKKYNKLFKKYCTTKCSDINWLLYATTK
ncbi:alginate lyase family protein [Dysgonomonas massiliensis]|uniref:alginate lyase family protein n=1 Tax=Dysgonomonas massiliensis TaxID=2040292 RepID=UPI000C79088D|nr:alginate lyase family protein [Dysgonomonas massiliensis]